MKENESEPTERSIIQQGDNSFIEGANNIINSTENGKQSVSNISIERSNQKISATTSMKIKKEEQEKNRKGTQSSIPKNNSEKHNNNGSYDNLDLSTELSKLREEMNNNFTNMRRELKVGLDNIAYSINNLANSISNSNINPKKNSSQNSNINPKKNSSQNSSDNPNKNSSQNSCHKTYYIYGCWCYY